SWPGSTPSGSTACSIARSANRTSSPPSATYSRNTIDPMNHPIECEADIDDRGGEFGVDYLETIALLQEEVARLEQELRGRDERPPETSSDGAASDPEGTDAAAAMEEAAAARAEIERLESELAGREETIGLLLDQLSRVEEAHAANRAEWEQLAGWLA